MTLWPPNSTDRPPDFSELTELTFEGRDALARGDGIRALELLGRKHCGVVARFGERSVFAATSAVDYGEALAAAGHYPDARAALAWAAERYAELGVDDERRTRALSARARAAYQEADDHTAAAEFRALIAELAAKGSSADGLRAEQLDYLAQLHLRKMEFTEAEGLLADALAIFEREGPDRARTLVCLGMTANSYIRTRRYREAEAASRRIVSVLELWNQRGSRWRRPSTNSEQRLRFEPRTKHAGSWRKRPCVTASGRSNCLRNFCRPATESVAFSRANLARYRNLAKSIGIMFGGGNPSKETMEGVLPKGHPQALIEQVGRARQVASLHRYQEAGAIIDEAATQAIAQFGSGSRLHVYVLMGRVSILRRETSRLFGEATGQISPLESMTMQLTAHERRGLAEDDELQTEAVEPNRRDAAVDAVQAALKTLDELGRLDETAPNDVDWNPDVTSDALEVVHQARRLRIIKGQEAADRALALMQRSGLDGAAPGVHFALDRLELDAEGLALRESYRHAMLEYRARMADMVSAAMDPSAISAQAEGPTALRELRAEIDRLGQEIAADGGYRSPILALVDLRGLLRSEEAVAHYYVGSRATFVVLVTAREAGFVRVEIEGGPSGRHVRLGDGVCHAQGWTAYAPFRRRSRASSPRHASRSSRQQDTRMRPAHRDTSWASLVGRVRSVG